MTTAEQTASTPARKRKMAREPQSLAATAAPPIELKRTKAAQIIELLNRPEGVTIEQLTVVTGWLPHTTRSALTGLRKKGHNLCSAKPVEGGRIYRIAVSAENAK